MALDEAQPLSIQDRFKAGAGEIRDKLRNMTVPKISLPDRPKINLPDRSKMKLPDRPQFLKERPQFLKERPQFLRERPQFLKEKPQFLKEKPKFLTQKPKFLSERPKFNMPDRSKFKVPERFKFEKSKKVDKPKIRKPNPSSVRRPLRDAITISSESSHNLFQTLKARTYPRFMTKKKREREKAAQLRAAGTSLETESSPPSPPVSSRQFPERFRDIKFADEDPGYVDQDQRMEVQSEEGYEENTAPFHERYERSTPYITAQGPDGTLKAKIDSSSDIVESDKEQISSGASSMRHRVGVLEEIDSDEFFLRQKGLSREDVDVSRYLSKEIRDAFRSPRNVLAHMDSADSRYTDEYEGEEGSPDLRYRDEPPEPPGRTKNRSESRDSDFNTFPIKPTRRKHSEGDFGSKEIFEKVKKPPRKYRSKSDTRQGSVRSLDRSSRRSILFDDTPQPPSRQKSLRSLTRSRPESATDVRGGSVRREVAHDMEMTPVRPLRKSRSRGASVDERTSRGADSLPHDYGEYEQEEEEEEIDIEEEEMEEELEEEVPEHAVHEHVQVFRTIPVTTDVPVRSSAMDDEEIPGYATVRKPKPPRPPLPPKSRKEQLQSQLHSIKAQGINFFQTFPRRAMKSLNKPRLPVRPLRNYSALGPVRPPRRNRVFREPVYVDGDLPDSRAEGEDLKSYDLKHEYEETRDLQRGEIVERMKGRPLPPPPRPPRRSKDDDSWQSGAEEQEDIGGPEEDLCELEDDICEPEEEELPVIPAKPSRREEFLASLRVDVSGDHRQPTREVTSQVGAAHAHPTIESSQQTSFEMPDVSVSIQTDPLPEGYIVDDRSEGYARFRSRTTESSGVSQIEQRQPERRPVEETIQRRDASSLNDPRRLFDPDVIRASEYATDEAPPPLPHRNIPPIPITIPPITIPPIPPVQVSFPDKLHLAQLDVDKLNVNELQANSIKVSDIDGVTMQISEIASASGNLVLNGIELPPDFIKNLVSKIPVPEPPKPIVIEKVIEKPVVIEKVVEKVIDRVRETTPQPHLKRILTPPPPIVVQHSAQSAEEVPSPPIQQASTVEQLPKPVTTRTRRKSPTRIVDDSEDELASVITERERKERERLEKEPKQEKTPEEQESVPRTIPIISEEQPLEPSALALIKQLLSIWYRNIVSGTGSLVNGINSIFPENDKRRDAQTAAVILIVIIAALILLGIGADQSVHHHHWDYLNPPR
uniref:Zonadhesin n=2 Tax=Lygus hesperus TaxID=30085 RepID=A0A0A9XU10_LYGHE